MATAVMCTSIEGARCDERAHVTRQTPQLCRSVRGAQSASQALLLLLASTAKT